MQVVINNQALETFFTECVSAFYSLYPDVALAIEDHAARQSAALINCNGMSSDGDMMLICAYPQRLYPFIRKEAAERLGIDDVWRDEKNFRLFLKVYKKCAIKTKTKYGFKDQILKSKSTNQSQPASSAKTAIGSLRTASPPSKGSSSLILGTK